MCSVDKFLYVLEFVELSVSKIMLKTGKWKCNMGHGKKKKDLHMKGGYFMCMVSAKEIQENIS
jgi:hypothetical protein